MRQMEEIKQVSRLYKVLSDPARLGILLLLKEDEHSVTAISEQLGMEQSAVSHQLRLLGDGRAVRAHREGKMISYTLDDHHVIDILDQTFEHIEHRWEVGRNSVTRVALLTKVRMKDTLKIGLLGSGTVGTGVSTLLKEHREKISQVTGMNVIIERVFVRNLEARQAQAEEYGLSLTTSINDILEDKEIQVAVELVRTIEPAKTCIARALEKGRHIVTANKDLLVQHGDELVVLVRKHHCDLYYETGVAGGTPILKTVASSLAADDIQQVLGIVNGMASYMFMQMAFADRGYGEVLAKAQALGFTGTDPTNDVDGVDAACKMAILSRFAFGVNASLPQVDTRGIRGLSLDDVAMAKRLGYGIRLTGSTGQNENSISVEVAPMLVNQKHLIAPVRSEYNAVFIKSAGVGKPMYYGSGAGAKLTAAGVVSDLITIARNTCLTMTGHMLNSYQHEI